MKYKRQNKGITLVTLVITVVVMLILAGVAIAQFTGGDGIFSRVTDATREYKKQSMLEAVDLAKAYLEMEKTYKNEPITITDVIDKVKEISSINDEDYIITIDDEEQSATIIDKETGVVIDIWIDENGEIQVEGSIVDDIENVVKPTITYTLDPPAGTYGEAVKITITATEEKNGIVRMVLPDNSEITYNNEKTVTREYTVTENGTYKFTVEGANGRETTKYVKVDNIMSASEIVMEVQNTNPTNQNVSIKITYDENVKSGGQVLINADRFQYSIGENNWQIATEAETTISVGVNGIVYARYYDGTTGFKTKSITVQNIDKVAPNAFNLSTTKTTNSITISGSTIDTATEGCATANYGIAGYQFQLKNSEGTVIRSWTTLQAGTSYTFNNLTQGTTYKVSMRAVDKAGNPTEATNKDESVTLNTVIDSSTAITSDYNPKTPTTENVQVTFTNNSGDSSLTLKYQKGSTSGSWTEYTEPITMETNGYVYASLFDENDQHTNTAVASIQNIDRVAPVISSATASTSWGATNSVTIVATDTGTAGCAIENIGIVGYGINQSSTTEPSYTTVAATTSLNTTINNITSNGTYYVWIKDKAGNTGNKQVIVNRIDTTAPTTATITSSNIEETTFTLTATGADGQSGIAKYEFYINNTLEKTVTTTEGTATYNVTGKTGGQNYKYKVRVYDKVGLYKDSSEITVTTVAPIVDPEEVAKIGDFVNYSVNVDGKTYDQWRILDFDNNGHMEIVCYNGPDFTLGSNTASTAKTRYANAIQILNDESIPYGEGTYGYSTRHLGSDPSNPSRYATISTSYIKFYSDYSNLSSNANYRYIVQTHHESDVAAVQSFSNTEDGKKMADYSWLASRLVFALSSYSHFYVRYVNSSGALNDNYLYYVDSDGYEVGYSASQALAPVIILESGVKIDTSTAGNGSEGSPWTLTK